MTSTVPLQSVGHYVDSSVVYSLAFQAAHKVGNAAPPDELARAQKATAFLQKVQGAGGRTVTSPLALEEFAARVRNSLRDKEAKAQGCSTWRDLKKKLSRTELVRADTRPHQVMLRMLALSVGELSRLSVELERTAILSNETQKAAQAIQKAHLRLLNQHVSLDAMDAFHIALAAELGITHFISFDKGWGVVPGITVYY